MPEPLSMGMIGFAVGMVQRARTSRKRLLEHPLRGKIMEAIRSHPGLLLGDLRRRVGCSASTIQHHVHMLERQGLIKSWQYDQRRHLFPMGLDIETEAALAAISRRSHALELISLISQRPGVRQMEVSERLSISRKVLGEYVRDLEQMGLVGTERNSGRRIYFPTERSDQILGLLQPTRSETSTTRLAASMNPEPASDEPNRDPAYE